MQDGSEPTLLMTRETRLSLSLSKPLRNFQIIAVIQQIVINHFVNPRRDSDYIDVLYLLRRSEDDKWKKQKGLFAHMSGIYQLIRRFN